ncbi:amidohydrolase family protein, partial [Halonatronum saccharophilum]
MNKLLLKGGKLIDPLSKKKEEKDLLIEDEKIVEIGEDLQVVGAQVIDVKGKVITPGFVDIHVHLREPGFEYKETIESGSKAAAKGGFTTIVAMPNTNPVIDNPSLVSSV